MSFKDFTANYKRLEICSLGPESLKDESKDVAYNSKLFEGGWKRRVNAGGCRNFPGWYFSLQFCCSV
jgi:calpain, invertebrate